MKKYLFSTFICALLALVGCQKSETGIADVQQSGEKVVVTANIQGSSSTRVEMTDEGESGIKVKWKESGETFMVANSNGCTTLTQKAETNQFEGSLPNGDYNTMMAFYNYTTVENGFGQYNLSAQNGTLDEKNVLMVAFPGVGVDGESLVFNFLHQTFILKPTFKDNNDNNIANNTITQIIMGGLTKINSKDDNVKEITVDITTAQNNIYIFVPYAPAAPYEKGDVITFEVTAGTKVYEGTYTLTNNDGLRVGNLYTAEVTLTEKAATPNTCSLPAGEIFKNYLTTAMM